MRTYRAVFKSLADLIQHNDNIEWSDQMRRWREDPKNKKLSVAGDDRSPAFTWIGNMYHNDAHITVPADNLMRCLMGGGAMVPVPGGRNGKTFKSQSQSGMSVVEEHWPLFVNGRLIAVPPLLALTKEADFERHCAAARDAGFMLYVKRVVIGQSKHVRVRPRFANWELRGTIQVWDDQLTTAALRDIATAGGMYKGLCEWRPGGKTPGPFGRFSAEIEEVV